MLKQMKADFQIPEEAARTDQGSYMLLDIIWEGDDVNGKQRSKRIFQPYNSPVDWI